MAPAQPAAPNRGGTDLEADRDTRFGATPERDLRPQVNATSSDYLAQLAKQGDPAAKMSDVEVIFWRNAVKPEAVAAYHETSSAPG